VHPHDAEVRGIADGQWVRLASRSGETTLRAKITDRVSPGVVYTTFHYPETQANVITTDYSDWATNCPEYKVTAVQIGRRRVVPLEQAVQRMILRPRLLHERRGRADPSVRVCQPLDRLPDQLRGDLVVVRCPLVERLCRVPHPASSSSSNLPY
jgi:formylmethanofuran dehydrogenase subunit D